MTTARPAAVIVLAAGEGTRMKSAVPKVLHAIGGRTLLGHAIEAARGTGAEHLSVVVRHDRDLVAAHVAEVAPDAIIADQDEVKGTGRATECALDALPGDLDGTVLVTYGDVPLLSADTLHGLLEAHTAGASAATVITATLPDPTGYGRILRDADGSVAGIVEQKDATDEQRAITRDQLRDLRVRRRPCCARRWPRSAPTTPRARSTSPTCWRSPGPTGLRVGAHLIEDLWQTEGVNDRVQLARLGAELNRRVVERLDARRRHGGRPRHDLDRRRREPRPRRDGPPADPAARRDDDRRRASTLGPDTTLTDVEVGAGASVVRTHGSLAVIGAGATVGPFAYLRPGTELGAERQDRHVRGDQERRHRRRLQGAAPVLRRRRHDRRGDQHRRGHASSSTTTA